MLIVLFQIVYTPPPQIIKPAEEVIRPSCDEPMVRLVTTVGASLKTALAKQMQEMSIQDDNKKGGWTAWQGDHQSSAPGDAILMAKCKTAVSPVR